MKRIFDEHGGTISLILATVALIAVMLMSPSHGFSPTGAGAGLPDGESQPEEIQTDAGAQP
jgi:hypothetical protein